MQLSSGATHVCCLAARRATWPVQTSDRRVIKTRQKWPVSDGKACLITNFYSHNKCYKFCEFLRRILLYISAPSVPLLPCPRKLSITVDNQMRLYVDGTEKTGLVNANDWMKADTVDLPLNARVIAVQGTDLHVVGGILASTDDGSILTDSSWKCTNVLYKGWQLVDFDDSSWPSAYAISLHQTTPWTLVPGIKTNAYWIWTPKYQGGDLVVYCRKYIGRPIKLLFSSTQNRMLN